ncbi:hypothetical protein GCM10010176_103020 [Nonomuraea spiralis]|nr:hypothetical protein GCM10010176_103020 [Nonomuraea spiralis]
MAVATISRKSMVMSQLGTDIDLLQINFVTPGKHVPLRKAERRSCPTEIANSLSARPL